MAEPPATPPLAAPPLNGRRTKACDWLRSLGAVSLAELYEGAIRMLENRSPGYIRFVAHAVREIANRLPGKVDEEHERDFLPYPERMEAIRGEWAGEAFTPPTSPLGTGPSAVETMPQNIAAMFKGLLDDHIAATQRIERSTRGLIVKASMRIGVELDADTIAVRVREWNQLTRWFVKQAHDRGIADGDFNQEEFRRKCELFETMLASLFQDYVDAQEGANEILERANR